VPGQVSYNEIVVE
jgi:hypothetical protein